jgi:16S rRNA C967 or C1407 C5-methylase (RsmB/RsmF family)
MKGTKTKESGPAAFDRFYSGIYGARWPSLKEALLLDKEGMPWSHGLARPYLLDPASVLAALALPEIAEGEMADLCAAPGGKCLVLAGSMPPSSRLIANERSQERSARLRRVLDEHLDAHKRALVSVTNEDAAALCRKRPQAFDRILLDAPCSSERHVLASGPHLGRWTQARAKSLAMGQWALLSGAFLMLRPGGCLAYATCSINPGENDGGIAKLSKKYGGLAAVRDPRAAILESLEALARTGLGEESAHRLSSLLDRAEATESGLSFMPDRCGGAGPLYLSLIGKAV